MIFRNFRNSQVLHIFKKICVRAKYTIIYYTIHTKIIKYIQGISSKINLGLYVTTMAVPLVEFSREGYKIRKVFGPKKNSSQMKSLNFLNCCNEEVLKSDEI